MDMSYTPEEEAFRTRVRTWLEANVPPAGSLADDLEAMRAWQRKLHGAGLLARRRGRRSTAAPACRRWSRRSSTRSWRARARPGVVNAMAIWWVGPAIMRYGTDAQKQRFIPKILDARGDLGDRLLRARRRAPTWRRRRRAPSGRATTTSSTARRSGPRSRTSPTGTSSSSAPRTRSEVGAASRCC